MKSNQKQGKHLLVVAYFEGCPTYQQAHDNALKAVEDMPVEVRVMKLDELPEEMQERFQGSPTLYLDGEPLFAADDTSDACRLYQGEGGKILPAPTADAIRAEVVSRVAKRA